MFLSDGGLFSLIPTLLFILIILLSIIFGILRGFRKSVILGIQALVAFVACLIAYFVIVNNAQTDTNIVNIANVFLGDGGLQNTLGVSTNNSSLTDIIMELILNNTNMGNGMALVLEENGAYLMAITNLVYHIVFFVLLWIVYLLLVFIFYIIYFIFYPERRHSRKVNKKYQETDPDKKYKKHRIFGGAIGALRGIVAGFMVMSVIGAIFYVVGGTGEGEYKEYDWGDDTYNTTYSIYSQTGSYGNSGIFKVLNTIKDQDNVPFYLFMANNFLSGNSYEGELKSNLVLSKDLGAVTVFTRSSFDLILKYGKEDIISAIKESGNSEEGSNKLLQVIGNVYSNIEFQNEFNKLIDDFNTNTFFIDMTFSVLDSFVNHMNEMTLTESLPKDTVELLNVLFNNNYISPYIPDDQANFEANGEVATIKPNMLLQKEDVKVAFKITFNVLRNESTNDQVLDTVNLATTVMDDIDELSLLNSKNKDNFNPVFERLYTYLSNYYLSEEPKEEDNKQELLSTSYLLEDTNSESLDWVNEINSLLKSVNSGLKLFSSVYELNSTEDVTIQIVNSIYNIFDVNNEKYEYNHGLINDVVDGLSTSILLGKVLETNFITKSMVGFLEQMTQGTDLYIPDNIKYANTSTEKGEIYNLFKGIEALFSNTDTKTVITDLVNGNSLTNDDFSKLCNSFLDDDEKVLNYLLSSKLVSSTVSGLLLSINIEDIQIIYPNTCKEMVDSKYVNLIQKEEIKELIRMVPDLLTSLESSDPTKGIINFVVDNKDNVSQSDILCATVANYLSNSLPSELSSIIVVPNELKEAATKEELTKFEATNPWRSEIKRLLDVFEVLELNDPNLDFSNSENLTNQIIGNILELNDPLTQDLLNKYQNENYQTKLDLCYGSPIILATLTKQIDNNINEEFIDDLSKEKAKDNGNYKKIELRTLIDSLNELEITDFSNINVDDIVNKVLNLNDTAITNPEVSKLDVCYESIIIKSVIAKQLDKNLTEDLVDDSTKLSVKDSNGYYNKEEVSLLLDSLNEFEISSLENIDINEITNKVLNLNNTAITNSKVSKLDVCYSSIIIESIINKQLDDNLGTDIIDTDKRDSVKVSNKYPKSEISSMLYALKELGISDITAIDITAIQNKVLNLNDPSIKSPESLTKLNVCYESKLIDIIVTKQLDDNLGDDIIDTDKRNSVKVNEQYAEEEVSAILYALKEFEITNITSVEKNTITNKVPKLNNPSIKNSEITKLDVCYESELFVYIVVKQMDDSLDSNLIETSKRDSVKVDEKYTKEEMAALVSSLNELEITDLNNFDKSSIETSIVDLNKTSTIDPSKTKLELIYESMLSRYAITKQIDTNFDEELLKPNERETVKECHGFDYYIEPEVAALIDSLNELGISDVTSIDKNDIKNKITILNENADTNNEITKLDVLYGSMIVSFVIANQITPSLNSNNVHENVINYSKEEVTETEYYYKKIEIKKLIDGINAIGISTIDEVSGIGFNSGSNVLTNLNDNDKLTTFYQSYILVDILTSKLDNIVDTNNFLIYNPEAKYYNNTLTLSFYKQLEVKTLIDFINEKLCCTEFSNVDSSSITIDSAFKNYTANSKILAATMTKQIIDNPSIEVPSYTILDGEYNEGDYIIQNEMDNLIDGLITLFGTGTIDGIDLDISLDSSKIDAIYNSNILNATISKQLASNVEIVIPSRVLKEATTINEITNNEVKAFLTSVTSGLGISGTINDISSSDVKLPSGDLDLFVESDIMRATVTKNVKATGDDPLFVENSTEYCEKTNAVDETNILVLSKAEVKALINAIKVLNTSDAYEINLSISTLSGLNEASLNTLLESNIIRIYVTTILVNAHISLETTNVDAYELGSTLDETANVQIADKTAIKSALAI